MRATEKQEIQTGYYQLIQILTGNCNIPLEVVEIILMCLPLTFLIDVLESPFDVMLEYPIKATYKRLKHEMIGIGGYEIKDDGTVKLD